MIKNSVLFFMTFCSLQVHATTKYIGSDTVHCTSHCNEIVFYQTLQPAYLEEVVVPTRGSGNWFVSITGGATAFLGTPLGCEDLFGRLKPSYSLALGKWFTPSVGARVNYSGLRFKDAGLSTHDYHHIHADLLWNVFGWRYARQGHVRWSLSPFVGVGLLHNAANRHNPFAISYGIQGQYRISKRVSALVEFSGATTFQEFDGFGHANRLGDHMMSLTAGLSFSFGKVGWKRSVDNKPYIYYNQRLVDNVNALLEQNSRYAGQHDKDRRVLAELRKILDIEGLLDTYRFLFDNDSIGIHGYPKNNYSGLNSLRARLKNRHWNGKSPLQEQTSNESDRSDSLADKRDTRFIPVVENMNFSDSTVTEYLTHVQFGSECIGSPVFFFFKLGTSQLTDASQRLNLDELARVAKKYGLFVKISGAADSATGTNDINNALSALRADYITSELLKRGVPSDHITKTYEGGISDYVPDEDNRHTKVMLYFR